MKKHHSGSEWELKWWEGGSEKWGCRPEMEKEWIGEMRVDRRKMIGSEWETEKENSPWASTESELGSWASSALVQIGASTGSELDSSSAWSGSELVCGSELVSSSAWSESELVSSGAWSGSKLGCVDCIELGSWCVGVDCFVWLSVWVEVVKLWERQCVFERGVHVRERRKTFEVKIWAEIDLRCFWLNLRSNWKYFQFDRIYHANQTCYFPENDFRISFSAKTNGP